MQFKNKKISKENILKSLNGNNKNIFPLSFTQERFWFLSTYENGTVYCVPSLIKLIGNLDIGFLESALSKIVQRHSVLRTNIIAEETGLTQKVSDFSRFDLEKLKCSKEVMQAKIDDYLASSINLEKDNTFVVKLYEINEQENYLFLNGHNTILDGMSEDVLYKELSKLYTASINKTDENILELPFQYGNYAKWEREYWDNEKLEEGLTYWTKELQGVPALNLETSYPRPENKSFKGDLIHFEIDDGILEILYEIRTNHKTSLLKTLFSVYSMLLHRYTNQDEIIIGILSGNREYIEVDDIIGPFSNALAIKQNYSSGLSFSDLLNQVSMTFAKAIEYQYVPFASIVNNLNLKKDRATTPVFQTMFELNKDKSSLCPLPNLNVDIKRLETIGSKFDLSLSMTLKDKKLFGFIEYATDVFSKEYIDSFIKNFQTLLKAVTKDTNKNIFSYKLYDEKYNKSEQYFDALSQLKIKSKYLLSNPEIPVRSGFSQEIKEYSDLEYKLDKEEWISFEKNCNKLKVNPNELFIVFFSKVVSFWSKKTEFSFRILQEKSIPSINLNLLTGMSLLAIYDEVSKQLSGDLIGLSDSEQEEILLRLQSTKGISGLSVAFSSNIRGETFVLDEEVSEALWLKNETYFSDGNVKIRWIYQENIFENNIIEEMFAAYLKLIDMFLKDENIFDVSGLSLLSKTQKEKRLAYNKTAKKLNEENLLVQIMKKARACPENEAIYTKTQSLTYKQLNNASIQIAKYIESKNLKKNAHIALILPKGWEQVVGVIGIGYAGKAYLPIEINTPQERINTILEQANVQVVLTNKELFKTLEFTDTIEIEVLSDLVEFNKDEAKFEVKAKNQELAYTIFTSGSTGRPKGVVISHENVCNTVMDINERFKINDKDRIFAVSALNFDLSVFDIYGSLSSGACIVMPEEEAKKDPSFWFKVAVEQKVTVWNSVPAIVNLLCNEANYNKLNLPESLRLILMSGDFIPVSLTHEIEKLTTNCEIISLGGATEGSIWSIYYPITDTNIEKIPYGYPLYNQQIDILDAQLLSRPDYVHGDIYIKGKGVAQGYLNDDERTAEQFVFDEKTQEIIYKTGDIGYFNSKGYVEILGRVDEQVKIQGYRVELGEIEQQILQMDEVKEAIVLAVEGKNGSKTLIGYVVAQEDKDIDKDHIKRQLTKRLPEYMIPRVVETLEIMPLTANGKIDKKMLLAMDIKSESSQEYIQATGDIEEKLEKIFKEVLNIGKVGIKDDFFDIGGHSLLAIQLIGKINKSFNKKLALATLFEAKTIQNLKILIESKEEDFNVLVPIQTKGNKRSIFAVPGSGGTTLEFYELSKALGENQPFYGFQSVGIDGQIDLLNSIEEMAKVNIEAMKKVQPEGPYQLIGYSCGGFVAYEMIRMLKNENDSIIILDTFTLTVLDQMEMDRMKLLEDESLYKKFKRKVRQLLKKIKKESVVNNALLEENENDVEPSAVQVNNELCASKYQIKPLEHDVNFSLFCTKIKEPIKDISYGWQQFLKNDIMIYNIAGGHLSILREKFVANTANTINIFYKDITK